MTVLLKDALQHYFKASGREREFRLGAIQEVWEQVMDHRIQSHATVIDFRQDMITIRTSNAVWRNELSLQKMQIMELLNNELHEIKIRDIRFK